MKVILTGATGFVGREVLAQCLQNTRITTILALSRTELPPSPKLTTIRTDDFLTYPPPLRDAIQDADACIW